MATKDSGLITVTVASAGGTYTRSAGDFTTDGFAVGMPVRPSGFVNAGNNGLGTAASPDRIISTLTATVLTARSSTNMVNETSTANTRIVSVDGKICGILQSEQFRGSPGVGGWMRGVRVMGGEFFTGGPGRLHDVILAKTVPLGGQNTGLGLGHNVGGRRNDIGNPTAPSLLVNSYGRQLMPVPVTSGARTITIDVLYWPNETPPSLLCKRQTDIGVNADVEAFAGACADSITFVSIVLSVTVGADGALEIYRKNNSKRMDAWVFWDNLVVT